MNSLSASDLASRLNLKRYARSWRGICPACDYAGATFSLRAGREDHALLYCSNGCNFEQLNDALAQRLGDGWKAKPPEQRDAEAEAALRSQKSSKALAIFNGSTRINLADPVGLYLARRHIPHLATSAALRFRGDCYHPEGGRYPALAALVQDASGTPVACHRTYLMRDGRKAAAEPAKASKGPIWGAAIRLHPIAPEIVVGEGIETSASAGLLLNLPAWAAISAGNLARGLVLPPDIRCVVIAADRDPVGARSAQEAASRWRSEGRRIRIAWPNAEGDDFNDILTSRMEAQRHAA